MLQRDDLDVNTRESGVSWNALGTAYCRDYTNKITRTCVRSFVCCLNIGQNLLQSVLMSMQLIATVPTL